MVGYPEMRCKLVTIERELVGRYQTSVYNKIPIDNLFTRDSVFGRKLSSVDYIILLSLFIVLLFYFNLI